MKTRDGALVFQFPEAAKSRVLLDRDCLFVFKMNQSLNRVVAFMVVGKSG